MAVQKLLLELGLVIDIVQIHLLFQDPQLLK